MGCNASKVPLGVVVVDGGGGGGNNGGRCSNNGERRGVNRSISALDFTTSTEFFRRSSSLLLWKPAPSSRNIKKEKSEFQKFKEQVQEEDDEFEKEEKEKKEKFMTSLSASAVR
jgi:hypothetical protein